MARGDVEIKGESQVYVFNFGTNGSCRVEEVTGRSYGEVLLEVTSPQPRVAVIRQFVQGTLVKPAAPTLEQAGEILDDLGGWGVFASGLAKGGEELLKALQILHAQFGAERLESIVVSDAEPVH